MDSVSLQEFFWEGKPFQNDNAPFLSPAWWEPSNASAKFSWILDFSPFTRQGICSGRCIFADSPFRYLPCCFYCTIWHCYKSTIKLFVFQLTTSFRIWQYLQRSFYFCNITVPTANLYTPFTFENHFYTLCNPAILYFTYTFTLQWKACFRVPRHCFCKQIPTFSFLDEAKIARLFHYLFFWFSVIVAAALPLIATTKKCIILWKSLDIHPQGQGHSLRNAGFSHCATAFYCRKKWASLTQQTGVSAQRLTSFKPQTEGWVGFTYL